MTRLGAVEISFDRARQFLADHETHFMGTGNSLNEWVSSQQEGKAQAEQSILRYLIRDGMEPVVDGNPSEGTLDIRHAVIPNDSLFAQRGKGKLPGGERALTGGFCGEKPSGAGKRRSLGMPAPLYAFRYQFLRDAYPSGRSVDEHAITLSLSLPHSSMKVIWANSSITKVG